MTATIAVSIYTSAILVNFPAYYFEKHTLVAKDVYICAANNNTNLVIGAFVSTLFATFLPLIVISITQGLSYFALKKSTRDMSITSNPTRIRQIRRVNRGFAVVVIAFFVMTTPSGVLALWLSYNARRNSNFIEENIDLLVQLTGVLYFILIANSATNPLIYSRLDRKIRRKLTKCLSCLHRNQQMICRSDIQLNRISGKRTLAERNQNMVTQASNVTLVENIT